MNAMIKKISKVVLVTACLSVGAASANTITLDVTANIDGRDDLIITGNRLTWEHFDFTAVGLHNPDYPSTLLTLTTTNNGVTVLNNYAWTPTWPNGSGYGDYSSTFTGLYPGLPIQNQTVELTVEQARWSLTLLQLPLITNGYTTIVEFNDNPPPGDALYQARLTFTTPIPAAIWLVGSALVGLIGFGRGKLQV